MNATCKTLAALWAVATVGAMLRAADARAQDCDQDEGRCGYEACDRQVWRPVYTTKKEKVTCWDYVCEPVFLPIKGKCCSCVRCAEIRTRKKLVRKTFLTDVPVLEWMAFSVCDGCADQCASVPEAFPEAIPQAIPEAVPTLEPIEEGPVSPEVVPPPAPLPPEIGSNAKSTGEVRPAEFVEGTPIPHRGIVSTLERLVR